jgi:hypothetical protein
MTFEAWLATFRLGEPDEDGQVGTLSAGGIDFFREVFARSGPVSSDELRVMWQGREMELARRAVPLIVADIRSTTDLNPHIEVRSVDIGARWSQTSQPGVTATRTTVGTRLSRWPSGCRRSSATSRTTYATTSLTTCAPCGRCALQTASGLMRASSTMTRSGTAGCGTMWRHG